jgi:hypothetical protein
MAQVLATLPVDLGIFFVFGVSLSASFDRLQSAPQISVGFL